MYLRKTVAVHQVHHCIVLGMHCNVIYQAKYAMEHGHYVIPYLQTKMGFQYTSGEKREHTKNTSWSDAKKQDMYAND
jgi:hypothetical protein